MKMKQNKPGNNAAKADDATVRIPPTFIALWHIRLILPQSFSPRKTPTIGISADATPVMIPVTRSDTLLTSEKTGRYEAAPIPSSIPLISKTFSAFNRLLQPLGLPQTRISPISRAAGRIFTSRVFIVFRNKRNSPIPAVRLIDRPVAMLAPFIPIPHTGDRKSHVSNTFNPPDSKNSSEDA